MKRFVLLIAVLAILVTTGTAGAIATGNLHVHIGRVVQLDNTNLLCVGLYSTTHKKSIECTYGDRIGTRPNSYSVFINEQGVTVFHYDAQRKFRLVKTWHHGE